MPAGFTAPSSDELQQMAQQRQLEEERQRMMQKQDKEGKNAFGTGTTAEKWKKIVLRKDWKPKSMV